jgi:hypothetical protein
MHRTAQHAVTNEVAAASGASLPENGFRQTANQNRSCPCGPTSTHKPGDDDSPGGTAAGSVPRLTVYEPPLTTSEVIECAEGSPESPRRRANQLALVVAPPTSSGAPPLPGPALSIPLAPIGRTLIRPPPPEQGECPFRTRAPPPAPTPRSPPPTSRSPQRGTTAQSTGLERANTLDAQGHGASAPANHHRGPG